MEGVCTVFYDVHCIMVSERTNRWTRTSKYLVLLLVVGLEMRLAEMVQKFVTEY